MSSRVAYAAILHSVQLNARSVTNICALTASKLFSPRKKLMNVPLADTRWFLFQLMKKSRE